MKYFSWHTTTQICSIICVLHIYCSPTFLHAQPQQDTLEEVVVTGSFRELRISESTENVKLISSKLFKRNPSNNIFDAIQAVNGVRPQLNCSVCATGDIHINGMEGAYTLILIDGMPIMSGLSSVYGLNGIPNSIIERVEILKGSSSVLYGSEAIGGIINIITKSPINSHKFSADIFSTSWAEVNADVSGSFQLGKKVNVLTSANYFNFQVPTDNNSDGFTDMTLQHRLSFFNKLSFKRPSHKVAQIVLRYIHDDRWGGETRFNEKFRGGDSVYGESIRVNRFELLANYQPPIEEDIQISLSYNVHLQDAAYGNVLYIGEQHIAFGQAVWSKKINEQHHLTSGLSLRYTYFDDNTVATNTQNLGYAHTFLPGIFISDDIKFNKKHTLSLGLRYDYNSVHKSIFSPRISYKLAINPQNIFRVSLGTGYRVVNIFSEDHAAISGSRDIIIADNILPETSYTTKMSFTKKIYNVLEGILCIDAEGWYTYFTNKIIPDYETNYNEINYANLNGFSESYGLSTDITLSTPSRFKASIGATYMYVSTSEHIDGVWKRERQLLTEEWSGKWNLSYRFELWKMTLDYSGNIYGPMLLPLASDLDPRPASSPIWDIHNIQLRKTLSHQVEIYGGVKNIFNWLPTTGLPFYIARADDPFDKNVTFDSNGFPKSSPDNPYGLTFDSNYVYAYNQGIHFFLGVRLIVK